jgi:hypothetical protein
VEGKEKYHVEVSNRLAALEHLDANAEMIKRNIKIITK